MPNIYISTCKAGAYRENALPVVNGSSASSFQKLTAAGASTAALGYDEVFYITSDTDGYVSFGTTPNATTDPIKLYLPANQPTAFYATTGHKIAWAPLA